MRTLKHSTDASPSGGTLRLRGSGDVDQLDPARSLQSAADQLQRLYARQLFTYPARENPDDWQAIDPVPDLAAAVPSTYNAGLGASHTCHIVHLRPGVLWDTDPAREVTAHDVVRGIKRMCSPTARPASLGYLASVVRGMSAYCERYAAAVERDSADPRRHAEFQNAHDIPGVFALDDETLVVELIRPTLDLAQVLALPCASAAPAEYDAIVPGSPDFASHARSNGPYRIAAHRPGAFLRLEPNPVWRPETDPVRAQHLDAVEVTVDRCGPARLAELVDDGSVDLPWGSPTARPGSASPARPWHRLGHALDPYLVFNLAGDVGGPLSDAAVRGAVADAIDREALAAIVAASGTGEVAHVAETIVPPGNDGHRARTSRTGADRHRSRARLPAGLTLTVIHPDGELDAALAASYAADLEKAGAAVRLRALDPVTYRRTLAGHGGPAPGHWDLAALAWSPAWFPHNARAFLQPLFAGGATGSWNVGGYRNPDVDALMDEALRSVEDPEVRDVSWNRVEDRVLEDAAIVPLLFRTPGAPGGRGSRVRNAVALPALGFSYDLAAVRLAGGGQEG